jgi:glucan biosynthesis protein
VDIENQDQFKYHSLRKKAIRDQRKITESAIELGQQRAALKVRYLSSIHGYRLLILLKKKAERWAFQEMKRELQLQEILQERLVYKKYVFVCKCEY